MESLSATVDARDAYTAGHSRRVQQLALAIGRELGLSQAELELLGHAALFHDIGKLAIPDAILLKPASLTDEEWALMPRHAEEGASIINRLGFLNDAVPAIRHHHERFDGTGYPDGLAGEEIPLGARIIHVADAFDSMLTTRVYRPARPAHEALARAPAHGRHPSSARAASRALERDRARLRRPADGPASRAPPLPRVAARRSYALRLAPSLIRSTILGDGAAKPATARWRRSIRRRSPSSRPGSGGATPTSRSSRRCARAPSGSAARRR